MQLSFAGNLPKSLDYPTLMDAVFDISYLALFAVIVECIYIRKLFHRLHIQSERLKDELQLTSLGLNNEPMAESVESKLQKQAADTKRRKHKIKKRIRHTEKILFVVYNIIIFVAVLIVTIVGLAA